MESVAQSKHSLHVGPVWDPPPYFRPLLTWDDLRAIYHCNPIPPGIMGLIRAPKPKGYISFCVCRIS